jgi:hypothetical protein
MFMLLPIKHPVLHSMGDGMDGMLWPDEALLTQVIAQQTLILLSLNLITMKANIDKSKYILFYIAYDIC